MGSNAASRRARKPPLPRSPSRRSPRARGPLPKASAGEHPPRAQRTVLLADDFADALDLYSEYLSFNGFRVLVAANGADAIELARRHRPDLILLDVRMPVMSGTEAMRQLRREPAFRGIPLVALTAHALESERAAILASGFDEVISKPCLPNQLVDFVRRLLDSSGDAREARP